MQDRKFCASTLGSKSTSYDLSIFILLPANTRRSIEAIKKSFNIQYLLAYLDFTDQNATTAFEKKMVDLACRKH